MTVQPLDKLLVIFDFDHSLIDVNSDTYIFEQLAPSLVPNFTTARTAPGYTGWTNLMKQQLLTLSTTLPNYNKQCVIDCLHTIIIDPALIVTIRHLHNQGATFVIISDANTIFIDEILCANKLNDIFDTKLVYTNPATYSHNDVIDVQPYHTIQHNCTNCPTNLCKGSVLQELKQKLNTDDTYSVAYIGDGGGDYCPCTQLSHHDLILCRHNWALSKMLAKHNTAQATVKQWRTQADVATELQQFAEQLVLK